MSLSLTSYQCPKYRNLTVDTQKNVDTIERKRKWLHLFLFLCFLLSHYYTLFCFVGNFYIRNEFIHPEVK